MESLAQELIDAIIEEVYHSSSSLDQRALNLRATSLVCRSWLPTSQRFLFKSVDLTQLQPRNLQQLYGALLESPHLAGHIIGLSVETSLGIPSSSGIIRLLLLLNKLIFFQFTISDTDGTLWDNLDLDFKQAIVRTFQLPTLRAVYIDGHFVEFNELTSLLRHARFLRFLFLFCDFAIDEEGEVAGQQEEVAGQQAVAGRQEDEGQFERFDLGKSGHLSALSLWCESNTHIPWLLGQRSHFTVENIDTLTIYNIRHRKDGDSIERLLHAIGTPHKTLTLSMYIGLFPSQMLMDFDSEAKSLKFTLVVMSGTIEDPLYWLLRLFSPGRFTIFGEIKWIQFLIEPTSQPGVTGQEWSAWGAIDRILTESQFECMATLSIEWREGTEPWVETADVEAMFPSLMSKRKLRSLEQKASGASSHIHLYFEDASID